jgi:hypothetical protein
MTIAVSPVNKVHPRVTALYLGAGVEDRLWFPIRKMIWREGQYHVGKLEYYLDT